MGDQPIDKGVYQVINNLVATLRENFPSLFQNWPKVQFYSYHFVPSGPSGAGPSNIYGEIIFWGPASNPAGSISNIAGIAVGCTGGQDLVQFTCSAAYKQQGKDGPLISWDGNIIQNLSLIVWQGAPTGGVMGAAGSGEEFFLTPTQISYSQGGATGQWFFKTHWCEFIWAEIVGGPPLPQPPPPPIGSPPSAGEFNDPAPDSGC